jgi:tetratricopeptide (TPR) repeat protein
MGSSNYKRYAAMSKENYQFYFKKLLDINEEYLAKILEKCFIVTQSYTDLRAVIRDTPNDHVFLARFLNNKNMWKEAKKEFMAAINLETTNPLPYFDFAHAFFSRGDFENAINWWQKQKALNPQDGRPYLFSARCFMRLKRFGDAVQELQELVSLYPENINYRIEFIRILIAADRVDEAIDEYRKIARRNPKSSRELADSIRYYQSRGNYSKATKTLNEALSSLVRR